MHLVPVFGNRQDIARIDSLVGHPHSVDLHAVAALQIADVPVARIDRQLAMMSRDIRESQHDVATLASPDQQALLQQRDRVSSPTGTSSPNMSEPLVVSYHCDMMNKHPLLV